MRKLFLLAASLAAGMMSCCPVAAQTSGKISDKPTASTLTGTEQLRANQGTGCALGISPCADVKILTSQIVTFASASLQPLDPDLTSLAAQTTAADRCQYWSGSATAALYSCTGFVRGLGTSADAAGFRAAIGLGSLATQSGTFSGTSSGNNTGDNANTTGNAGTATRLATARNINGVAFDGTASITINAIDSTARAAAGANTDITSLAGLTTPLSISQGGTGRATAQFLTYSSGVAVSVTGSTSETTLATITIPAGALGINGSIEIIPLWTFTNNANAKTLKIVFGGATFFNFSATTSLSLQQYTRITNRGSASSQVAFGNQGTSGLGNITTAPTTASVNTSAATTVTITATLANAADTATLESYLVRVTYGS